MSAPHPFTEDAGIATATPTPMLTHQPVTLRSTERPVDLQVKVSYPEVGDELPVIVFSHGHGPSNFGSSMLGYEPLCNFWAQRGFVVIQPTHLDATMLGRRDVGDADEPLYAVSRVHDMRAVLDQIEEIARVVPGLRNRVDTSRIAAAGHSMGGHTVNLLLGAHINDPETGEVLDLRDDRITVGVPMCAPGLGADLDGPAGGPYAVLRTTTFEAMTGAALVVTGEDDHHEFFSSRTTWRSDDFTLSPGPKTQLTISHAEHMLGGVSGWDSTDTSDENPTRVAAVRAAIWAYLRSVFYPDDAAWDEAVAVLQAGDDPLGRIQTKTA